MALVCSVLLTEKAIIIHHENSDQRSEVYIYEEAFLQKKFNWVLDTPHGGELKIRSLASV